MRHKLIYICCTVSLFIGACTGHKSDIIIQELKKDFEIMSLLDDSIVWQGITGMECKKQVLYFSDYENRRIVMYNHKNDSVHTIGKKGEGPGEFIGIHHFWIENDTFYIVDGLQRAVVIFQNDNYVGSIKIPDEVNSIFATRFFYSNSLFYFPNRRDESIICIDKFSNIKRKIGPIRDENDKGARILFPRENSFISIGVSVPVFEEYSMQGELLRIFDLTQIPVIQEKINLIKSQPPLDSHSFRTLIKDGGYADGKTYILCYDYLLSFDMQQEEITLASIYQLENLFYTQLCIDGNSLYLFDMKECSIVHYTLDN